MQGLFEELRGAMTWFAIEQRESFAMVLACEDVETVYVSSVLQGLDQSEASTIFMTFAHPVRTARAFVDVCVEMVEIQRQGVNERLADKGAEPWPELSGACRDPQLRGADRIRALLEYVRARVEPETLLVLTLLPTEIDDVPGYVALARELLPSPDLEPWMRNVRLFVRDARQTPFLLPELRDPAPDGVEVYVVDFSQEALEEGLASDASNEAAPPLQRGLALLQLAALDFAHRRYPQALEKYGMLYNLFDELGNPGLAALCLCGAGDVHRMAGHPEDATLRYRQGLEIIKEGQSPPVMLNLLIGAGTVSLDQEQYVDAEQYWDLAARVAGAKLKNVNAMPDAMEMVGVARYGQGNAAGAIGVWEGALEVIAEHPNPHRKESILRRMLELAEQERMEEAASGYRERHRIAAHELKQAGGDAHA